MTRTFCTVVLDPAADAVLAPVGELFARARHWCYREIHLRGRSVASVKKDALPRFGITARQFNGIRFELDQAVNAWRGTARYRVQFLKDAIEATRERIEALGRKLVVASTAKRQASLRLKQVGKKQRLDRLRGRLLRAKADLASSTPKVCFGGRELLRRSHADPDAIWRWRERRGGHILLVGAKCEAEGNQTCRWDGRALRLRLPNAFGGTVVTLDGVTFRYGQEELLAVLARNRSEATRTGLTWLLFRDERGRWNVRVTVGEPVAPVLTDARHGVIAVDLNVDHLAVVLVDRHGNPHGRLRLPFPDAGVETGKAAAMIGDAVRGLTLLALKHGYAVAAEDLDFSRKKAGLREYGTAHARRLSGFAYAKFHEVLKGEVLARRSATRRSRSGVHERDRSAQVRPLPGHVAASCGGVGDRPRGDGIWRTPRLSGRHRPRRTWKDASEDRAASLAGRS
ncbi:hypothetical protein M6G65_06820 [Methylobacterium tardum]|uniref:hypothetical protein n=1 Tax=Methylobacterium tardum TaxID=374432 RepID=UPI0020202C0E|nr:hypothetical protein [Methylobacterium tardum]URD38171.1 hypothetical protein M6G65_06820 [Methylobacterium tardum]